MAKVKQRVHMYEGAEVSVLGTGGEATSQAIWQDGQRTDDVVKRDGAAELVVTGLAVSIRGVGYDGAIVKTTTPLDVVPAGTVFKVEGDVEVTETARADAGFERQNGGRTPPRPYLETTIFLPRLIPEGTIDSLLASKPSTSTRPAKEAS